jgi:hypothetical protein
METVNNLASAASRAIWGEGKSTNEAQTATEQVEGNETKGQEPVSGQTGNVEAGEPYDKGNSGGAFTSLFLFYYFDLDRSGVEVGWEMMRLILVLGQRALSKFQEN